MVVIRRRCCLKQCTMPRMWLWTGSTLSSTWLRNVWRELKHVIMMGETVSRWSQKTWWLLMGLLWTQLWGKFVCGCDSVCCRGNLNSSTFLSDCSILSPTDTCSSQTLAITQIMSNWSGPSWMVVTGLSWLRPDWVPLLESPWIWLPREFTGQTAILTW